MSTTIRRYAALLGVVLPTWGAILLALPFTGPAGRQVAVIGGEAASLNAIRAAGGRGSRGTRRRGPRAVGQAGVRARALPVGRAAGARRTDRRGLLQEEGALSAGA
ncbi:MAG: hypothetical protein WDN24_01925 [Sphingomonas sp.]